MSYSRQDLSRRRFLQSALGLAALPALTPLAAQAAPRVAANERITVGAIGLGGQGFGDMMAMLHQPDTQIVALCDVDSKHYRDKPWGQGRAYGLKPAADVVKDHYAHTSPGASYRGLKLYSDFREVCNDPSIDAVIVATPDHWHALCTLEALRNGKDVYCEKPLTHLFHEGQAVYREAARQNAVFQVGSQQRSNERFRHAVELVLNGHIGKIHTVEVGLCPGYDHPMGDTTIKPPPDHLNYDFWCGPSEKLPYMRARSHRFWRGHHDYGGGELMDWIGHHNDIAHWGMGMDHSGPTSVEAVDWIYPDTDIYNVPYLYTVNCEYAGGIKTSISTNFDMGPKWIGDKGWVHVNRSKLEASNP